MTRIGLIALASDPTMEPEWRRLIPDVTAFYVSRIAYANSCTPENLSAMSADIATATDLLLPNLALDALAFGCTSATIAIGESVVEELIGSVRPGVPVTTPITGPSRPVITLASSGSPSWRPTSWRRPDPSPVGSTAGISRSPTGWGSAWNGTTKSRRSTNRRSSRPATRLDLKRVDGLFLSCTALAAAPLIDELERRYGLAVLTSNQCLAWHALRLGGDETPVDGYGTLMRM